MPVRLTAKSVLLDLIQMVTDPPSVLGAVFGQRNAASHPVNNCTPSRASRLATCR